MPNDNAMARAAGERQVAFRASMLPIGNSNGGGNAMAMAAAGQPLAPAEPVAAADAPQHHSRSQPRGQAGRWAAPESFDGYMHGINQMLVDLDGDGQPDAVVPANTQMARASEGYATPPSDNLREMMPDYELPQSPYFLEDMMLDSENALRSRDGLPQRNGPPYNVPPPRRGNIISGR